MMTASKIQCDCVPIRGTRRKWYTCSSMRLPTVRQGQDTKMAGTMVTWHLWWTMGLCFSLTISHSSFKHNVLILILSQSLEARAPQNAFSVLPITYWTCLPPCPMGPSGLTYPWLYFFQSAPLFSLPLWLSGCGIIHKSRNLGADLSSSLCLMHQFWSPSVSCWFCLP